MIFLIIFLALLISLLFYLLFGPFYLEVDSNIGMFRIRFHRIAAAWLIMENNSLKINLNIAGWTKQIDPFRKTGEHKKLPPPKKKKRWVSLSLIKSVLNTFKITRLSFKADTGNMPLNAMLYPGFYAVSKYTGRSFEINFAGESEIILKIENNFARIIKVFIIYSFNKLKNHGKFK